MAPVPTQLQVPPFSLVDCPWYFKEYLLLARVPPALLREAWAAGINGESLLESLLKDKADTPLYEHLQKEPTVCKMVMGRTLSYLAIDTWGDSAHLSLLRVIGKNKSTADQKHLRACTACSNYSGYIRGLMRFVDEVFEQIAND